jgi:hypothetical protein
MQYLLCSLCTHLHSQAEKVNPQKPSTGLLQLPEAALALVLQQLDQCSLACVAVTCSTLSDAAAAASREVAVCCKSAKASSSFTQWLERHSTSLDNVTHCSIEGVHSKFTLPCSQLRQLHMKGCVLQLGPSQSSPVCSMGSVHWLTAQASQH